ncbi:endonuclease III [Aeoliella mucimassa]|uniref:Endonuclease III n=1 Tax=Aeoliella mucimassa TaxID=2527972 RepID=A0A518AQU5_9BACT|nr:endonuclease III [Aeoliella mucimassa]QDU57100.1 Ultraviolet N-glycosylase/AP lyase [Aeoliella mucimassa]
MAKKKASPKKSATKTPAMPVAERKKQAAKVVRRLEADYPDAECALTHDNAYQLLIATILSAQCTDERVNIVTEELFAKLPTPADIAGAPIAKLEKLVQSTGFFRNKAKNIKACSQALVDDHQGEVPKDLDILVNLPGVGRKTANVVLGTAFGIPTGVVVDTHVGRLSRRLGLTTNTDAVKVEKDLMEILPKPKWIEFSHRMIHHGRAICNARKAKCDDCSMKKFCPQIDV